MRNEGKDDDVKVGGGPRGEEVMPGKKDEVMPGRKEEKEETPPGTKEEMPSGNEEKSRERTGASLKDLGSSINPGFCDLWNEGCHWKSLLHPIILGVVQGIFRRLLYQYYHIPFISPIWNIPYSLPYLRHRV